MNTSKYELYTAHHIIHNDITIIDELVYIFNHVPFEALTGPNVYSTVPEMTFDLT